MRTAYDIIKRPIITEQSMEDLDIKKYVFEVAKDANKIEIKKAVEEIFGVEVASVHTINRDGKVRRQGNSSGRTPSSKKAYVKLKENSKGIEFFDSISQ